MQCGGNNFYVSLFYSDVVFFFMFSSICRIAVRRSRSIIFSQSGCSRLDRFNLTTERYLATCKFRNSNLQSLRLSFCKKTRFPIYSTRQASMVASASSSNSVTGKFERLPAVAKPQHYTILLKPDLEKFTFEGEETIQLEIVKATNSLKFYCSDIKIKEVQLNSKEGAFLGLPVSYQERWETAQVELPKEISPQSEVTLTLKFDGILNDKMKGFYRSQYKTSDGKQAYLASTQFESTSARKAFPCWDEPVYKAKYDITLIVPKDKTALSNMPEVSSNVRPDGLKVVKYDTTPIMSSYLVAFVVGDFEYVEGKDSNGVLVRVYTLPGRKAQGEFALQVATKALPFYGEYFGIKYTLPKCDLVAIPDFQFGAMENWGLITYREVALLIDPKQSSTSVKEYVALVVAHELAHMWFGNLVTMEWWTDLWLKEGYATWMEYYFVDHMFPEFDIWTQFVNFETYSAMGLDALKNSHPIEVPINDPDEVEEIYDNVSYAKSASVIRMLNDFLGDDVFRQGLRSYLAKYASKNAVTLNLWESLSQSSGKSVGEIMGNWTKRMGYPVVKVSSKQEGDKRILHLQQRRFIADGSEDEEKTLWQIPISISTSSDPTKARFKTLLTGKEQDVPLDGVKADEWVKLNAGCTGYYRVQYSDDMLKQLLPAIKNNQFKATDRFSICSDVFALVRAGQLSATSFLDLLESYENERDYTVWADIDSSVAKLNNCLERTDYLPKFNAFCRKLYTKIADKVGWEPKSGESHTDAMLRPLVLGRLGRAGDEKVLNEARSRFQAYVKGSGDMVPDLRSMVFGLMAKFDGEQAYQALQGIFEKSDFSEVQRQALTAIGRTTVSDLQKKALDYGMSEKVRLQDLHMLFAGVSTSASGQDTAWNFYKTNFKQLIAKYGNAGNPLLAHALKFSCQGHCSEDRAKEIEAYFHENDFSAALHRPIKQSLESVRLNVGLLARDAENVKTWLTKKGF